MIVILPVLSFLYDSLSAGLVVRCIADLLYECDSHTAGLVVPV